ncbi:MAG: hypothetical protein M9893_10050 [Pyrinomonadaceae bacterium]|nr:hypothetical protein [Pyrinomonadaceae bacterium]
MRFSSTEKAGFAGLFIFSSPTSLLAECWQMQIAELLAQANAADQDLCQLTIEFLNRAYVTE